MGIKVLFSSSGLEAQIDDRYLDGERFKWLGWQLRILFKMCWLHGDEGVDKGPCHGASSGGIPGARLEILACDY